ncbi:MAG: ABC transporter substrate-binding protein, partial [Actinobacteria bacterium]|nr:ABC transporter substrate-binding protein [Actinomycetota bacterium]
GAPGTSGAQPTTGPGGVPAAPSTPLKVGVYYASGVNEAAEALGLGALSVGDTKAQATALADDINANGGLAGRKIQLFFADASQYGSDANAAYEGACRRLVEDDDVDLLVTFAGMSIGNFECFVKAGVGVVNDISNIPDDIQAQWANLMGAPGDLAAHRLMGTLVDYLWSTKWLTKDSTIGVYTYDDAANSATVDGPLKAALAKYGLKVKTTVAVTAQNAVSQGGSVVLRFASDGVDRVLPVGASPLFVMNAAESQGYRPDYALYSSYGPGALLESSAPKAQLEGAAGVGWAPFYDIGKGKRPGPVSSQETRCFSVMEKAGQGTTSNTTKALQATMCNMFFYLEQAADKIGSAPDNLLALARPALRNTFVSPSTFKVDVTNRVDGVAAFRPLTFESGCSCFQYGELRAAN